MIKGNEGEGQLPALLNQRALSLGPHVSNTFQAGGSSARTATSVMPPTIACPATSGSTQVLTRRPVPRVLGCSSGLITSRPTRPPAVRSRQPAPNVPPPESPHLLLILLLLLLPCPRTRTNDQTATRTGSLETLQKECSTYNTDPNPTTCGLLTSWIIYTPILEWGCRQLILASSFLASRASLVAYEAEICEHN